MPKLKSFIYCVTVFIVIMLSAANFFGQNLPPANCDEDTNYDADIAEAAKGIKFSSYNLEAFLKRGYALMRKGEFDQAIKDLNRAVELNPKDARGFSYRGELYAEQANYEKSIKDFTEAIKLSPDDECLYYSRARSYSYNNQRNLAFEDSKKTIELNPQYINGYYSRGSDYLNLGYRNEAIEDWKAGSKILAKEIEKQPNKGCIFYNYILKSLFDTLSGEGIPKALESLNKSIEIKSDYYLSYYYRGITYHFLKNYQSAIIDFDKAIKLNPNFAEIYKIRAETYNKIGENEKAEADRKKYKELSSKP